MDRIKRKQGPIRQSAGDRAFNIVNAIVMTLTTLAIVYPLYYVLLASITDPVVVSSGKLLLYPEAPYLRATRVRCTMRRCGPATATR